MKFSKILKFILLLAVLVLLLFLREIIINSVVSTNLEVSQEN